MGGKWKNSRLTGVLDNVHFLVWFTLAKDHGECKQEQNDATSDLKCREWNVNRLEYDFTGDNKENEGGSCNQRGSNSDLLFRFFR